MLIKNAGAEKVSGAMPQWFLDMRHRAMYPNQTQLEKPSRLETLEVECRRVTPQD